MDVECTVPAGIELAPIGADGRAFLLEDGLTRIQNSRDFEGNFPVCEGLGSANWFAAGDNTGLLQPPVSTNQDCESEPTDLDSGTVSPEVDASDAAPERDSSVVQSACVREITDRSCATPESTHNNALVLESRGHTDWGSLFADYGLAGSPNNFIEYWPALGTGYDGIAIIAKSPEHHDKSVTILLDDIRTTQITIPVPDGFPPYSPVAGYQPGPEECEVICPDPNSVVIIDPVTNLPIGQGSVPPPGSCGNSFRRSLTVAEHWQLYLLPWNTFVQDRFPNASPTGIDPSQIRRITIRAEKEADLELWIDEIAFYRFQTPGDDAGAPDASQ